MAAASPSPARVPAKNISIMIRFVSFMVATDPLRAGALLLAKLVDGIVPAVNVWIVRRVFTYAVQVSQGLGHGSHLLIWVGIWAVLLFAQSLLLPAVWDTRYNTLQEELEDALQAALQNKASRLRLEAFERSDYYDLLGRARNAAKPGFFMGMLAPLFNLPSNLVTLCSLAILVGSWSPWLLVAVVVAALPNPISESLLSRNTFFVRRAQAPRMRLLNYYVQVLSSRDAAKEVRTYDLADWIQDKWRQLFWVVADAIYRVERAQGLAAAGLRSLAALGVVGGLAFAGWSVARGSIDPGEFAAMLVALREVQSAVVFVLDVVGQSFGGKILTLGDLFEYLDLGPEERWGSLTLGSSKLQKVALDDVWFQYPQSAAWALSGITVCLRAGERVALVGENGSGKTTLVKVLTGLYRPTRGGVRINGLPMDGLNAQELRALQAAVFQDHNRYAFTLGENIGYGDAARVADTAAVGLAAEQGGAVDVAAALPNGYATPLTRLFSGGTELSGGQWQKVATSRGFMRAAPLIVLDEPTSALDPRAEAEVLRRFATMAVGRTALVVSHRLGFARLCERILVLRAGRLVEQGTHDELVALGGEYSRMWALQARWYQ